MKKLLSVLLAAVLMTGILGMSVSAKQTADTAEVYVTVADGSGSLVLTFKKVTVSDIDADGALTVNDALYAAHEAAFNGGAAAGYASAKSDFGLSLTRLWGVENGGSYGYAVNSALCNSLADPVKDGDSVYAYIYRDLAAWSDKYSYFDIEQTTAAVGDSITLTLTYAGFDPETYAPFTAPVEGARLTVNGKECGAVTDKDGRATVKLESVGTSTVSAVCDSMTLVPPVCLVSASTGDTAEVYVTISDGHGALVMTRERVSVKDIDFDGALTVNDALYAAHEAAFEGGAAAGYAAAQTEWGLSLTRLWGEGNGSYGYYVNHAAAWSLADPVKNGDSINAFVYTDLTAWSDTYCYFDANELTVASSKEFAVKLLTLAFNADGTSSVVPVGGAQLILDGKETGIFTAADGTATLSCNADGSHILSAKSDKTTLVPPALSLTVTSASNDSTVTTESEMPVTEPPTQESEQTPTAPVTADDSVYYIVTAVATVILAAGIVFSAKKRKVNEK